RSTRVFVEKLLPSESPAAKHKVALGHDTARSLGKVSPAGLGLATIDHEVPFQRSMRVRGVMPLSALPTAKQLVELRHVTSSSALFSAPDGFGLGTIDHVEPFH